MAAKIVVVTSGKGGVGKTTTSASFASGLALAGKKTAVIDFDGGGRFQCELTDVDPGSVKIGDRVEIVWERVSDEMSAFRFRPVSE